MPTIIDLDAEAAKLTMFRGLTPQTTRAERKGSAAQLPRYRDGLLLLGKSAGTSHWETHPEDELVHILDGAATLDIVQEDGPRSFALSAGMIAIVPPGAWHRFRSADGKTTMSAVIPGDHIDLDVDDPRTSTPDLDLGNMTRPPSIIDLNAELAKLTMFRGRTPRSTMADRKGSSRAIGFLPRRHSQHHEVCREGSLGMPSRRRRADSHPRRHGDAGYARRRWPQSFALRAGMVAVNPQGAWHRFSSADGVTLLAVTPSPSEVIDLDVDDPRQVERKPA